MVLWALAVGLALALRPHLQLALYKRDVSLEGAFWQGLEVWGAEITASLCIFRENTGFSREKVGTRCDLVSGHSAKDRNRAIFQQCLEGNCTIGEENCTQSLQPVCNSAQTPAISLNSVSFRPSISYEDLEAALCCSAVLSPSLCLAYSPAACSFPRHLQDQCFPQCTLDMLNEGLCASLCVSPCATDDYFCQCMQTCTHAQLQNNDCDPPCNVSACDYDNQVCVRKSASGDNSVWATWIVGSLSVGCFL